MGKKRKKDKKKREFQLKLESKILYFYYVALLCHHSNNKFDRGNTFQLNFASFKSTSSALLSVFVVVVVFLVQIILGHRNITERVKKKKNGVFVNVVNTHVPLVESVQLAKRKQYLRAALLGHMYYVVFWYKSKSNLSLFQMEMCF